MFSSSSCVLCSLRLYWSELFFSCSTNIALWLGLSAAVCHVIIKTNLAHCQVVLCNTNTQLGCFALFMAMILTRWHIIRLLIGWIIENDIFWRNERHLKEFFWILFCANGNSIYIIELDILVTKHQGIVFKCLRNYYIFSIYWDYNGLLYHQ